MNFLSLQNLNDWVRQNNFFSDFVEWNHSFFLLNFFEEIKNKTQVLNENKEIFLELLKNSEFINRQNLAAHLTTSSLVVHPDQKHILLLLHKKIGEWVYPGGHADGDWFLLRSALRECLEETGLKEITLLPANAESPLLPFFIHRFYIQKVQNTPEHFHYDAVYAFQAHSSLVVHDENESEDSRWFPISQLQKQVELKIGMDNKLSLQTAQLCLVVLRQAGFM